MKYPHPKQRPTIAAQSTAKTHGWATYRSSLSRDLFAIMENVVELHFRTNDSL
jgi:hypothetical protein